MKKRCPNCMEPLDRKVICPVCSYNAKKETNIDLLDKAGSILNNRYYLGKLYYKDELTRVYLGYDLTLEQKVFLREYAPETLCLDNNLSEEEKLKLPSVERFVNYGKSLAALGMCEILPRIYNVFEEQNRGYIVTEFFEGESLEKLLSAGIEISKNNALVIIKKLCNGLKTFHLARMIFGRISPSTVYILKQAGQVKIFGIGSPFFDNIKSLNFKEKYLNPSYAAPEFFETNKKLGPRADVYSLAATLYLLLTGITPTASFMRYEGEILRSPHTLNKNIEKNISVAINNAMNYEPEVRTAGLDEFIKELSNEQVKAKGSFKMYFGYFKGLAAKYLYKLSKKLSIIFKSIQAFLRKKLVKRIALISCLAILVLVLTVCLIKFLWPRNSTLDKDSTSGWYYGDGTNDNILDSSRNTYSPEESSKTSTVNSSVAIKKVKCPKLIGLSLEKATKQLENRGLQVGDIEYIHSSEYEKDFICSQNTEVGEELEVGASVHIKISLGKEEKSFTMPNLMDLELNEALAILKDFDLEYSIQFNEESENIGKVVEQNKPAFTEVKEGTLIIVTIGGERIKTPDLTGKLLSDATQIINQNEYKVTYNAEGIADFSLIPQEDYYKYKIIEQSIQPQTIGYKGQEIILSLINISGQ